MNTYTRLFGIVIICTGCRTDYVIKGLETVQSAQEVYEYIGGEDQTFWGNCGTFVNDTQFSNRPEDSLGRVYQRPIQCAENPQSSSCVWNPGFEHFGGFSVKEVELDGEPTMRTTVSMEDATNAGFFDWLGVEMLASSAVLLTVTDVYDGAVIDDAILDQEIDNYLAEYDSGDKNYAYTEFSKLMELQIQEYYFVGLEEPSVSDNAPEIASFGDGFYQDSELFIERKILSICVQQFKSTQ